jgi:hypothetical protein
VEVQRTAGEQLIKPSKFIAPNASKKHLHKNPKKCGFFDLKTAY